jgi:hypothetical protein
LPRRLILGARVSEARMTLSEDSPSPPAWFPDVFRPAVPQPLSPIAAALIGAPSLAPFWDALAEHVLKLQRKGWNRLDAAAVLLGCALKPLALGYDARGTLARKVRGGVNMQRRRKAASLALELAELLDEIAREPLAPDAALAIAVLLDENCVSSWPSYFQTERPAELLRRMAAGLIEEPDFTAAPGLASQKPSWRGFIREVKANLADLGFRLRERDAIALVTVLCKASGVAPPSRDGVHHALLGQDEAGQ